MICRFSSIAKLGFYCRIFNFDKNKCFDGTSEVQAGTNPGSPNIFLKLFTFEASKAETDI